MTWKTKFIMQTCTLFLQQNFEFLHKTEPVTAVDDATVYVQLLYTIRTYTVSGPETYLFYLPVLTPLY